MTKAAIAAIFSMLVFSATTAAAGNPSLCTKDGWQTAQSSIGQGFSSQKECAKAREVFKPTLAIDRAHVDAGERFTLTATGFHPGAALRIWFAITAQTPYASYEPPYPIAADGTFSIVLVFEQCGNSPDDLTITIIDAFGVHALARLILC